jgi:hypothetical protein
MKHKLYGWHYITRKKKEVSPIILVGGRSATLSLMIFLWQYISPFVLSKICNWVILKIHLMMTQVTNNKNGVYIIYWIRWKVKYYDQTIIMKKVIWRGGTIFILIKSPLESRYLWGTLSTTERISPVKSWNNLFTKRNLTWATLSLISTLVDHSIYLWS